MRSLSRAGCKAAKTANIWDMWSIAAAEVMRVQLGSISQAQSY